MTWCTDRSHITHNMYVYRLKHQAWKCHMIPLPGKEKQLENRSLKGDVNYSWGEERGLFSWPKSTKNQYLKTIMILWESESHAHWREVFSLPLALNHWTMEKWHTDSEKPFIHLFSNPVMHIWIHYVVDSTKIPPSTYGGDFAQWFNLLGQRKEPLSACHIEKLVIITSVSTTLTWKFPRGSMEITKNAP